MPSKSPAQKRLMDAVAHGWHKPGGGGPSVAVAKEFVNADRGNAMSNKGYQGKVESFAAGGEVLGRTRDFLKTPDQFTDGRLPPKDKGSADDPEQDYVKTGKGGKLSKMTGDKELPCKKPRG